LRLAAICGSSGGLLYALAGDVDSALAVPLVLSARFMAGGGNTMSTIANLYTINVGRLPSRCFARTRSCATPARWWSGSQA
jgi:hypothetical protein